MSRALAVYHGRYGRVSLYQLDRDMATHAHREGHLVFYISGRPGRIKAGPNEHPLCPGSGAAISPWQPHSFHAGDCEAGSVFLVLYIRQNWFMEFADPAYGSFSFGNNRIEVTPLLDRLIGKVSALLLEGSNSEFFDRHVFDLTLESYDESWRAAQIADMMHTDAASLRDFRIRNSIKIMKSRLDEGEAILLDAVARDAGISRPHFFKLFKENIGITPNIYLNTLRMETAIDRLTMSADAVTAIGLDLGFSSQASFTRFFVSNVGIPPSDYRRAAQLTV